MATETIAKIKNILFISKEPVIDKEVVPGRFICKCIFQSWTTGRDLKASQCFINLISNKINRKWPDRVRTE